ncbi:MAG: CHAD domain-containing protein [Steroidobacter sp.]
MNKDLFIQARLVVLRQLHRKLRADLRAVTMSRSAEAIHHARVDARRLRVIIKMLRKECQPLLAATLVFDLRNLSRTLAPVREADVRRQHVESLLSGTKNSGNDAMRLLTGLRHDQAQARRALQRHMHTRTWRARMKRIAACFADDDLLAAPRSGESFTLEHAALKHRMKRMQQMINNQSGYEGIHVLRIEVKRVRYLYEFLRELDRTLPAAPLSHLEKWQSVLGKLHDELGINGWLAAADVAPSLSKRLRTALHKSVKTSDRQFGKLRKTPPSLPR